MVLCGIFMKTIISLNMRISSSVMIFFCDFCYSEYFFFSVGAEAGFNYLFFIGLGITAYGFCYFMIHDVLIHQRFKWFKSTKNRYLIGLRKAHKAHHKRWVRRVVRFWDAIFPFKYYNM
jgi:beta-carotene 3-hydroxylase